MGYNNLETERINALNRRDAATYATLCDEMGIEPEMPELYYDGNEIIEETIKVSGRLERLSLNEPSPRKKGRRSATNSQTYAQFYVDGLKLSQNKDRDTADKERLLMGYFRRKFTRRGKSTLAGMDKYKLGSLFNHLMEYSKKFYNQ
ncbi:MAG: hypothetical protein AABX93_02035 [Nanoarchaeota archaeon]